MSKIEREREIRDGERKLLSPARPQLVCVGSQQKARSKTEANYLAMPWQFSANLSNS